jgi:hypothetical protein
MVLWAAEVEEFTAEENKQADQGLHLAAALGYQIDNSRRENVEKGHGGLRYMFGTESVVESYPALPVFFGLLPGNAYQVPGPLAYLSDQVCYTH